MIAALASFEAVAGLPGAFGSLAESVSALRRLREVEFLPEPVKRPVPLCDQRGDDSRLPSRFDLRFDQVTFRYPGAAGDVLRDISFHAWPGKRMAIVGHNGAGKSTVVRLLTRLWDVTDGRISVDGMDVRELPVDVVRAGLAVISGDTHVFGASVRDNLRIAKPHATDEEMADVLRTVCLDEWVQRLPDGINTLLGGAGVAPSVGERQRIAVARAILARPQVYLLDEPTSALPPDLAAHMRAVIERVAHGKTQIWIVHALQGLEAMDEILVLHRGRIVERGRHEDLLAAGGYYRRMLGSRAEFAPANEGPERPTTSTTPRQTVRSINSRDADLVAGVCGTPNRSMSGRPKRWATRSKQRLSSPLTNNDHLLHCKSSSSKRDSVN